LRNLVVYHGVVVHSFVWLVFVLGVNKQLLVFLLYLLIAAFSIGKPTQ